MLAIKLQHDYTDTCELLKDRVEGKNQIHLGMLLQSECLCPPKHYVEILIPKVMIIGGR